MKHFIIRLHEAERAGPHYDLFLESNGLYEAFTMPKGLPSINARQHLAIKTPDHTTEEASFEGVISQGYGKGEIHIIDQGEFIPINWNGNTRLFNLQGNVFRGNYLLIHWEGNKWLIRRRL